MVETDGPVFCPYRAKVRLSFRYTEPALTTDVCVASAARGCADRGYRTVIAADACTTLSPYMHQASLDIFQLAFGGVKSAAEIVNSLPQAAQAMA